MANRPRVKNQNASRAKGPANAPIGGLTPAVAAPAAEPAARRPSFNLGRFFSEVRAEMRKITWTSWRETWITSVMVLIMVVVTAIFFLVVDGALRLAIEQLLKLAAG